MATNNRFDRTYFLNTRLIAAGLAGTAAMIGGDTTATYIHPNTEIAHAADFDGDGDVDGADVSYFFSTYPSSDGTTFDHRADLDQDGDVDLVDYALLTGDFTGPSSPAIAEDAITTTPGDFDGDGDVDGVDVSYFLSIYPGPGGTKFDHRADLDQDGDLDVVDYALLTGGFTGPTSPAVVPEPGAMSLLALGFALIARRRRTV